MSQAREPIPGLEREAHLRKDLAFLERELAAGASVFVPVWREQNLFRGDRLALVPLAGARGLLDAGGELAWLGKLGEASCFALDVSALDAPLDEPALAGQGEFRDLRAAGASLAQDDLALAAFARAILFWHGRAQFCGACGGRTAPRQGGHMRACRDPKCKLEHFPRTDPAVIVLVHDGEQCLLGRQRRWPPGMFSTLAGFVEPGESLEQAVAREIAEESGIAVEDVRYFRSQPWPFPASLMLGFSARAVSREIRLADDELEDARFVSRDELRRCRELGFFVPGTFSLAGQLIAAFLEGVIGK